MHNSNDFSKIIEGVRGAKNILNSVITPELEASMTEDQLELLAEARQVSGEKNLKKMSEKLEKLNNKITR